jgi:hypothetical protein
MLLKEVKLIPQQPSQELPKPSSEIGGTAIKGGFSKFIERHIIFLTNGCKDPQYPYFKKPIFTF